MLQSMRELAHSWVAKGVMMFLMVSFSIWGIGDIFRGNPAQKTVAKVGDDAISVQELDHSFNISMEQARQRMPNLTLKDAKQLGLMDKTLDAEIKRKLVDQDTKRLGIEVPTSSILETLADTPNLRNKDGGFNKGLFDRILEQQGMTEQGFLEQEQISKARQILAESVSGSHFVPKTEIDAFYKARAQKRILTTLTVDANKMSGISAPDDKGLHSFYDENPSLFSSPEYRALTVASLSTDALLADITISENQLQKEYEAKKEKLSHPERRDILQAVLQDEGKAKQLASHAFVAHSLETAAKEDQVPAVPLNELTQANLMPDLAKVVFSLHEGEVSDPIKTQLGWHVIEVKKIVPAGTPNFAEIKDKLRDDLRRDQAVETATRMVNKLDDQLAAGHSLDDIADELKLRMIKVANVDAKGLTADGKSPDELPGKDKVLKDAFIQNAGDTSPIIDDKAGNYYVVRTDTITAAGVKPFETVRKEVADAWKAHERMTKAKAEADKIAQGLRAGKTADTFADDEGVSVGESAPISELGDTDPLLPREIATQAFALKKGETATAETHDKEIVAQLAKIIDADSAAADPRRNRVEGDIKSSAAEELFGQYLEYLHQVFPVKTNTELLNQLSQQGG